MSVEVFVLQAVKMAYEKWKESQAESLALSDDAKKILKRMQSDSSHNGIFRQMMGLSSATFQLVGVYGTNVQATVTNRVMAELEAKGLVTIHYDGNSSGDLVKLTHFGWILNPETGEADKVG